MGQIYHESRFNSIQTLNAVVDGSLQLFEKEQMSCIYDLMKWLLKKYDTKWKKWKFIIVLNRMELFAIILIFENNVLLTFMNWKWKRDKKRVGEK